MCKRKQFSCQGTSKHKRILAIYCCYVDILSQQLLYIGVPGTYGLQAVVDSDS